MIIRNATILDFRSRALADGMDVLITDGRVTSVGKGRGAESPDRDVIDAEGRYLIPGLVNTHAHTAMTLLRGAAEDCSVSDWFNKHVWLYEQNLRPEDVYWGTLLGAAEMLLAGVTWVADHYFHMERAWQAFQESGIRADLAWAVFGAGDGWREELDRAVEFTGAYREREPRLTVSLGPHSPYICPEPFLRTVADKAGELGTRMHIHVSEEKDQVERSLREKGRTPVEVLDANGVLRAGTILAHCYHATDGDLALVRERGAGIAHCAKTYLKFGDVHDFLPRALAAGVSVGLGSDGPASNNTMSILETARFAALLAKASRRDPLVARVEEVLPLCHAGGQVLGLPRYGRIEPGNPADLVVIESRTSAMVPAIDPFANLLYSFNEKSIHTVIVDGRVLVRQGKLVHLDMEQLSRKASEIAERLKVRSAARPMQTY